MKPKKAANKTNGSQGPQKVTLRSRSLWWLAAIPLFFLGGIFLLEAVKAAPGERAESLWFTAAILLGLALGSVTKWTGPDRKGWPGGTPGYGATVVLLGLGMAGWIWHFGMRQFGGFDHSVLIDTAWRLVQGQRPYIDFPCTLPVGFFLGAKYAFLVFGVAWQSLVLASAALSFLTFLWCSWLLERIWGDAKLALAVAVALQAMSLLAVCYWWYNPVTSICAAIFLASAVYVWKFPNNKDSAISYVLSLFLIVLMKPNLSAILVPGCTAALIFSARHRVRVMTLSLAAFFVFLLFLWLNGLSLIEMLRGYSAVAHRGMSIKQFLQDLGPVEKKLSWTALLLCLAPAAAGFYPRPRIRDFNLFLIGLVGVLAGVYGFLTNGESKLVDLTPVFLASILVSSACGPKGVPPSANSPAIYALSGIFSGRVAVLFVCVGLAMGMVRHRVELIGYGSFFEYQLTPAWTTGFFRGLSTGNNFRGTYEEVREVLSAAPDVKVAFGPRMQWAYAAFHKPSPVNQPVWWHPGVAFAADDEEKYMAAFMSEKPDLFILLKNDLTYYSPEFLSLLGRSYSVDQRYPHLTLLRRVN